MDTSYREECFEDRTEKRLPKLPLFNGALGGGNFDGKYKEFKKQENERGDDKEEYRPYSIQKGSNPAKKRFKPEKED